MGTYKEVKGDLIKLALEGTFEIIGHGCNCWQTMGAGIALQIKNNFPKAYETDVLDSRLPLEKLGDFSLTSLDSGLIILNLYTQYFPGPNLDYEALTLSLRKVNTIFSGMSIGLPKIGAGIAGGDWNRIKSIIKNTLVDMDVTVVIYKQE